MHTNKDNLVSAQSKMMSQIQNVQSSHYNPGKLINLIMYFEKTINVWYFDSYFSHWAGLENIQRMGVQFCERLASLGTMGFQLRTSLKPLEHHRSMVSRDLSGSSFGSPHWTAELNFCNLDAEIVLGFISNWTELFKDASPRD